MTVICSHPSLSSKRGCPRCHAPYDRAIREILAERPLGPVEPKAG